MTAYAVERRKVFIIGGGHQWRPLVHVRDVARAMLVSLEADEATVCGQVINIGSDEQNMQVVQMAREVLDEIPNATLEDVPDNPDKRSYRVRFDKAIRLLDFKPKYSVGAGVRELCDAAKRGEISLSDLRGKTVAYYRYLLDAQRLVRTLSLDGEIL